MYSLSSENYCIYYSATANIIPHYHPNQDHIYQCEAEHNINATALPRGHMCAHTQATLNAYMEICVSMISALLKVCDMWERLTVGQPPSCWSSRNPILQSALSFFSQYSDESRTLLLHKTWQKHILLSDWGTAFKKFLTYRVYKYFYLHIFKNTMHKFCEVHNVWLDFIKKDHWFHDYTHHFMPVYHGLLISDILEMFGVVHIYV